MEREHEGKGRVGWGGGSWRGKREVRSKYILYVCMVLFLTHF